MASAIFSVFFKIIVGLVNIVLAPINALVVNLVPDLSNALNTFNSAMIYAFGDGFTYLFSIMPPITRSVIILYLGFLITYYTITISAHAILKVYSIIKQIKIW